MSGKDSTELPTWKLNHEEQPLLIGGAVSRPQSIDEDDDSSNASDHVADESKVVVINEPEKNYYPLWVAGCFLVNYTVGAGVLGLPLSFYHSGYVQSTILLFVLGILNHCGTLWVVNAMYRGEAITTIATRAGVRRDTILNDPKMTLQAIKGTSLRTFVDNYHVQRNEYQLNELVGMLRYYLTFFLLLLLFFFFLKQKKKKGGERRGAM
ncbi:hypothetical protein RFI_02192 [Reticulomyxa filosa]|uniref:Uncharacterized protein n=1 Tax=Reticulomyxa filosa TaxID=46433 RepID=X6P9W6_RETFI|nr:hypothetical protein RFI_02192 [Reticulomyxa filosa]|eukprot:ETO34898.1 hypothetical protein RFI_02192 [Reticulomyxa filosa]